MPDAKPDEKIAKSISLRHLAFIIDGNRRWAVQRGLSQFDGHKRGAMVVREMTLALLRYGVQYVTFFVFSTENWKRSEEEVASLMDIFREMFDSFLDLAKKNQVRFIAIGDLTKLPQDIQEKIKIIHKETENFEKLIVTIAINYGGRDEIIRAAKKFAKDVEEGKRSSDSLVESDFAKYLDTVAVPYPDVLVRTGEKRISNFLLWQIAYSEIFFVDKFWPDFSEEDLGRVISEFSLRKRRYGV